MATQFPYSTTISGLSALFKQLRSNFPKTLTADTMKRYSIAQNNEAPVLSVMRFLGFIDENGEKTQVAGKVFSQVDNNEFQKALSEVVEEKYEGLFELYGDAWTQEKVKLLGFFRAHDKTTERVGQLQTATFEFLASMSGKREMVEKLTRVKMPNNRKAQIRKSSSTKKPEPEQNSKSDVYSSDSLNTDTNKQHKLGDFSLTVRIEINLPVTDDQNVYDKIFKSIKENFLNE